MKKPDKDSFLYCVIKCWKEDFWLKILTIASIVLIITSFFLPPTGVIDPSVMLGSGELMAWAALWQLTKAVNNNISAKVKIHEIELSLERTKRGMTDNINDSNIPEE